MEAHRQRDYAYRVAKETAGTSSHPTLRVQRLPQGPRLPPQCPMCGGELIKGSCIDCGFSEDDSSLPAGDESKDNGK